MIRQIQFVAMLMVLGCMACQPGHEKNVTAQPGDSTKVRINEFTKLIDDKPGDAELYNSRARLYFLDRQFDLALKDVNKAISISPRNDAFYVTLADIYLLMGQTENSRDALKKSVEINPGNKEALLKLSKLYLIVKDYQGCYATLKQVLEIDQNNAAAYYTRAIALLEQHDTNRAVSDLLKAVDKNQDYYEAYLELGNLFSIRRDRLAESYLKNALNVRPQSKEALYMLAMHYQETGQFEKAIATYGNLSVVDSAFRDVPYNIGFIYLVYLQDFNKAINYFTEAIKKDPEFYQAFYNRGYAYELAGDFAKAREDYQKSLKIMVNYDKAIEGLNRLDAKMIRK